jgi:hypothetical protein
MRLRQTQSHVGGRTLARESQHVMRRICVMAFDATIISIAHTFRISHSENARG